MRSVQYRVGKGRAPNMSRENLNELVMLPEAAIAVTNVERWAQERVAALALENAAKVATQAGRTALPASIIPMDVRNESKTTQYETSVVDNFVRLGAQSFAAHGTEPLWERKVAEGRRGPKRSVDLSLFNAKNNEEARIEFGYFTAKKLASDAQKLFELPVLKEIEVTTNYLILFRIIDEVVRKTSTAWRDECDRAAFGASASKFAVELRVASSQDLFAANRGEARRVDVGMFSVFEP